MKYFDCIVEELRFFVNIFPMLFYRAFYLWLRKGKGGRRKYRGKTERKAKIKVIERGKSYFEQLAENKRCGTFPN